MTCPSLNLFNSFYYFYFFIFCVLCLIYLLLPRNGNNIKLFYCLTPFSCFAVWLHSLVWIFYYVNSVFVTYRPRNVRASRRSAISVTRCRSGFFKETQFRWKRKIWEPRKKKPSEASMDRKRHTGTWGLNPGQWYSASGKSCYATCFQNRLGIILFGQIYRERNSPCPRPVTLSLGTHMTMTYKFWVLFWFLFLFSPFLVSADFILVKGNDFWRVPKGETKVDPPDAQSLALKYLNC